MSVTVRQSLIGFGYTAQSALQTSNIAGDLIRVNKLNASLANLEAVTENDAAEIGKGSEFAQNSYLVNWNTSGALEKYLSSEMAAWLFGFAFGNSVASLPTGGTASHQHLATPLDQTAGLDLPAFTMVEQLRPGAQSVVDRALVGCCLNDFKINIQSGPGRNSSRCTANFVGIGKSVEPSNLVLPAATAEHLLPAGSLGLLINGTDYISAKSIIEAEFGYQNNVRLDTGFYPGSGFNTAGDATSGQIRGRMEMGDRTITMNFVARFDHGSTEPASLKAQTEGSVAWTMRGALIEGTIYHSLNLSVPRCTFSKAQVTESNGIVTVTCELSVLIPSSGAIVSATTINSIAKVAAEA